MKLYDKEAIDALRKGYRLSREIDKERDSSLNNGILYCYCRFNNDSSLYFEFLAENESIAEETYPCIEDMETNEWELVF